MADEIKEYVFPPLKLLKAAPPQSADKRKEMRETAQKLMEVLGDFNVNAKLLQVTQGPSVTRYEIQPETGIKLSKITGLSEDIAWKLAVPTVLVAAVPGKAAVGIEVPNTSVSTVSAREILESDKFQKAESKARRLLRQGHRRQRCCRRYCKNASRTHCRCYRFGKKCLY